MIFLGALFFVLIGFETTAYAGAQPVDSGTSSQTASDASDPEAAFLSPTRYTNAYFGFEFDLPPQAQLQPVAMQAATDRRVQLLDLVNVASPHAAVSISAYEYRNKNYPDAKAILRRNLDQELFVGVEELHGLAKTSIDGHQFYYFETRRGVEQQAQLATEQNGYILLVVLQANDANVVRDLVSAFYHLQFFPPGEALQHAGPQAMAYDGPSLSSKRLREIKDALPAEHMDPGTVEGNVYRNAQIGMTYEFPKGWSVQPEGAVQESIQRYREKVLGEPAMGPRERAAVKACRRVLLSVWRTKPGAEGDVPYDDFGEVTLSAMPLSCFPNLKFPEDANDATAVRRFVVGLALTEPLQRDMSDARSYEAGGQPFVLTHGTIAYKVEGDELSRRISVATAFTQHHGYLLTWLIAAPHDSELRELLRAKVGFDGEPDGQESAASGPSPAKATATGHTSETSPDSRAGSESQATTARGGASSNNGNTSGSSNDPNAQMASRPTLLRDGESMESQQTQGKPLPKPN